MERRLLLAGMGALVAAPVLIRPAFAQNAVPVAGQPVGDDETKYMQRTAALGSLSLLASRMADKKVTNHKVKEFVTFEIAEQETIGDILMGMKKDPSQATGTVTPPTDQQAMANVDQAGNEVLNKLNALSGDEFQKQYIQDQVDTHKKLLDVQDDYLKDGKNREALDVAKLAKGMIKEHLQLLSDIQKMLNR